MSIFADDWRDCLREQYRYVVQQQDQRTEATLTDVLHEAGFSDDELAALRLEATMRAEDMPDDYVPEEIQTLVQGVDVAPEAPEAIPDEPPVVVVDEDEPEPAPLTFDELAAEESPEPLDEPDEPDEAEPDSPQQMSLF